MRLQVIYMMKGRLAGSYDANPASIRLL